MYRFASQIDPEGIEITDNPLSREFRSTAGNENGAMVPTAGGSGNELMTLPFHRQELQIQQWD